MRKGDFSMSQTCAIPGCDAPVAIRGLCKNHYSQWHGGRIEHPVYGKYVRVAKPYPKKEKKKYGKYENHPGTCARCGQYSKSINYYGKCPKCWALISNCLDPEDTELYGGVAK
jgi:predicted Zn-ribbon and HTH transcriptional regulator